jgi:L-aminopeptidase/D-esterase-like protein
MICHGFKGGIGTSSRRVITPMGTWTVGVLVQANHGRREDLTVRGVPVGRALKGFDMRISLGVPPIENGSIIVFVATDAPLLPHQLERVVRRVPLGVGRVGALGANSSGDIFLAFSTANPGAARRTRLAALEMLPNDALTPVFEATVQATEEAILNALVAGRTMEGIDGNTVHGLPGVEVQEILFEHGLLK